MMHPKQDNYEKKKYESCDQVRAQGIVELIDPLTVITEESD